MKIQSKRWVSQQELALLCEVTARRSLSLWKDAGMPVHKVLAVAGGKPRVACDVVEIMNWFLRTGRAVPVKLAGLAMEVMKREASGKRLKTDDILTEVARGSPDLAPCSSRAQRVRGARSKT